MLRSMFNSLRMIATSTYTHTAIYTCVLTALGE